MQMILAGDIGGTKTVIALFETSAHSLRLVREEVFVSRDHESLEAVLAKFLQVGQPTSPIQVGCFGVAGPVLRGSAKITNLPWEMEEQALARALGVSSVKLLNDLEATAYGMLRLAAEDFHTLNKGEERKGTIAVIAAGTGLGEAILFWDGKTHHAIASEGGHADFAPRNDQEIALLTYLRGRHGEHVSYERVLSGPGLLDLYRFLRESTVEPEPTWLRESLGQGDPSATIAEAGIAGKDSVCARAVEIFCSVYGAEAGNLALKCLALGGVLVGGGIAPKILPALERGHFMRGFTAKGRYTDLLQSLPVKIALNPRAALVGAAHYALRL